MTAPFLRVGAPVVRQSVFGTWLVDDGSLVPQPAADQQAAYAEAAARSSTLSPAAGPHRDGGIAPGSLRTPPADGSGALKTWLRAEEVGASVAVGAGAPIGGPPG